MKPSLVFDTLLLSLYHEDIAVVIELGPVDVQGMRTNH